MDGLLNVEGLRSHGVVVNEGYSESECVAVITCRGAVSLLINLVEVACCSGCKEVAHTVTVSCPPNLNGLSYYGTLLEAMFSAGCCTGFFFFHT